MRVINHRGRWKTVADDGTFLEVFKTEQEAREAAGEIDGKEKVKKKVSKEETSANEQETIRDSKSDGEKKVQSVSLGLRKRVPGKGV